MVKRFKKFVTLLATGIVFAGTLHSPVYAVSKNSGDDYQTACAEREAEIKKYGGVEENGFIYYKLDKIYDEEAADMTYESFEKQIQSDMTEGSADKGLYKDIVTKRDWYSYGSKYMYNQMDANEKAFYNKLYSYCMYFLTNANSNSNVATNYKSVKIGVNGQVRYECMTIPFSYAGLSDKRAREVYMVFDYENPQFYFLDSAYYMKDGNFYMTFYDKFMNSVSRAKVTNKTFSTIDSCAEQVKAQSSDVLKVRKAEEIVMQKNKYSYSIYVPGKNYKEFYDQSLYSTFNLGYTVCAGYCKGVHAILRKAGVSAMSVTSSNHAWNLVKVDGNWYNLDATWDDSTDDVFSTNFFLKSDNYIMANDRADQNGNPAHDRAVEWNGAPACLANYGTEWPSSFANINSQVDAADQKNASIKTKFKKVYTPQLIKGEIKVKLSKNLYVYDGSVKTPSVKVTMGGQTLSPVEYNVKYAPNRKDPGVYKVTVTLKTLTGYSAKKTVKFTVMPKKTTLKNVSNTGSGVTVSWKKGTGKISGYQIQVSPVKDFSSGVKSVSLKKPSVTSKVLTTLDSGRAYYFRVRTFRATGSGVAYSNWSKTKGLTVK